MTEQAQMEPEEGEYVVRLTEVERNFLGVILHRDGLLQVGASAAKILVGLQEKIPAPPER